MKVHASDQKAYIKGKYGTTKRRLYKKLEHYSIPLPNKFAYGMCHNQLTCHWILKHPARKVPKFNNNWLSNNIAHDIEHIYIVDWLLHALTSTTAKRIIRITLSPKYTKFKNIATHTSRNYFTLLHHTLPYMSHQNHATTSFARLLPFLRANKNSYDSLQTRVIHSKVIYAILTKRRTYNGLTVHFSTRLMQHIGNLRKLIRDQHFSNRKNSLPHTIHIRLYKFIASQMLINESFIALPLFRIHDTDADYCESFIINSLGSCVLNMDKSKHKISIANL